MHTEVQLNGKPLRVTLSDDAERALTARQAPLLAEMELYFSCLIRKQVHFHDNRVPEGVAVTDKLTVRFHPVMSQVCSVAGNLAGPPLTDFPIVQGERFSPKWLEISYQQGKWNGRFGY